MKSAVQIVVDRGISSLLNLDQLAQIVQKNTIILHFHVSVLFFSLNCSLMKVVFFDYVDGALSWFFFAWLFYCEKARQIVLSKFCLDPVPLLLTTLRVNAVLIVEKSEVCLR